MAEKKPQFNREIPMRTFIQIKSLAARMQTTDVQVIIQAVDQLARKERVVLTHNEVARAFVSQLSPLEADAVHRLLEVVPYDVAVIRRLKARLGEGHKSDLKFREDVYYDRARPEDFEVC